MNKTLSGILLALVIATGGAAAQSPSPSTELSFKPPAPSKEHAWLKQLEGEWDVEFEAFMAPGQPPVKSKGKETTRMLGGFWLLTELVNGEGAQAMHGRLTLGYDARAKHYTGTFISNMEDHLWVYTGALDAAANKLTLDTTGPNVMIAGKTSKFTETIELTDADHHSFSSAIQNDDGTWFKFMTARYTRRK